MRIPELLKRQTPSFSFEYFPPKTPEGEANLFRTVETLKELRPTFVSVTYGAGGSTRTLTREIVRRIQQEKGLTAMAHLTCVGHTSEEIAGILQELSAAGIENVLALRGDPPRGESEFKPVEGGFAFASELTAFIADHSALSIGGACYPEAHQEAKSPEDDLRHLKEKVDAGAQFLISQLFFDNDFFWNFLPKARNIGVEVPIIPGIMPILNVEQIKRFTSMCGATIPQKLLAELEAIKGDAEAVLAKGVEHATQQCRELLDKGAPGIHFYTLNKSDATRGILQRLYDEGYGKPADGDSR